MNAVSFRRELGSKGRYEMLLKEYKPGEERKNGFRFRDQLLNPRGGEFQNRISQESVTRMSNSPKFRMPCMRKCLLNGFSNRYRGS